MPKKPSPADAPETSAPLSRHPRVGRARSDTTPVAEAPLTNDALMVRLMAATQLPSDELLGRALRAFALANGIDAGPLPAVQKPRKATLYRDETMVPATGFEVEPDLETGAPRLFVHGEGRPPIEMVRDKFFIGSSDSCDLWVKGDKVATRHLRVERVGQQYFVVDNSTFGTFTEDGEKLVARRELVDGETLVLSNGFRVKFFLVR